jgi:hypothetical protein
MSNPYIDIWMKAGETAARQSQIKALADMRSAQIEASKRMVSFWFDAWTAPLKMTNRR